MTRFMKHLLVGLTATLLAGQAQAGKDFMASPDEPHGIVRTDVERTSEQIFPVQVVEIDGDLVSREDQVALWLKPGKHVLKVRGQMTHDYAGGLQRTVGRGRGSNELEITVEEGKTYYIGGQKNRKTGGVWKPVIWKVEPGEGAS